MNIRMQACVVLAMGWLGLVTIPIGRTATTDATDSLECLKSAAFFAPVTSPDYRRYAPDRLVELEHLVLDLTPDFTKRTIRGSATYTFKPIAKALPEFRLNAVDLVVESVDSTEKILGYQVTDKELVVTFAQPVAAGQETKLAISYHAQPRQGIYFRTPEMGYKVGDTHLFSQGEAIESRYWFPCFDAPNAKFTSEVICHVPEGMTVLSNGRQVSSEKDAKTGLVTVHWSQEKPHVTYLITLTAGYFSKLEETYRNFPLTFYTPPSEAKEAPNSFACTKEAMGYFESEIGVPYAWAKYGQVLINDFHFGGMENTSMTTLTDRTLFQPDTENLYSSEGLIAHELAHQWFGDLVTCKDWSHVWLNEGFATYYAHLFMEHKYGRDQLLYELYSDAKGIVQQTNDLRPIVSRMYENPEEQFGYRAYPKGSWVLHMLRSQLGEELYRRAIRNYLEKHQYGNVVTDDLSAEIEAVSGKSYDQFFDQWLYHGGQPELEVKYSWDERAKLAKVSVKQTQKLTDNVVLFRFPVTLRFKSKAGVKDARVEVKQVDEDFYVPLPEAPEIVRFDPEYSLLAKVIFNLPTPMLYAQAVDQSDVIGRLQAIEQLATKKDHETIAKLKEVLNHDPFYGVRAKASEALRMIHSEEALTALVESTQQPDARARNAVVNDIGGFYSAATVKALLAILKTEKNPGIQVTAIHNLGPFSTPEVKTVLLHYLHTESYRNRLADAAIAAMRTQDDPAYLAPLREVLSQHEDRFLSREFANALDTLAYLARKEEKKESVREFIAGHLTSSKDRVKQGAITALGTLEDPKAIGLLDTFANSTKDTPEQKAAEQAVAILRGAKKPSDDLKDLRKEVLDMQSDNRRLSKELEDLKKRFDATPATNKVVEKK